MNYGYLIDRFKDHFSGQFKSLSDCFIISKSSNTTTPSAYYLIIYLDRLHYIKKSKSFRNDVKLYFDDRQDTINGRTVDPGNKQQFFNELLNIINDIELRRVKIAKGIDNG